MAILLKGKAMDLIEINGAVHFGHQIIIAPKKVRLCHL